MSTDSLRQYGLYATMLRHRAEDIERIRAGGAPIMPAELRNIADMLESAVGTIERLTAENVAMREFLTKTASGVHGDENYHPTGKCISKKAYDAVVADARVIFTSFGAAP